MDGSSRLPSTRSPHSGSDSAENYAKGGSPRVVHPAQQPGRRCARPADGEPSRDVGHSTPVCGGNSVAGPRGAASTSPRIGGMKSSATTPASRTAGGSSAIPPRAREWLRRRVDRWPLSPRGSARRHRQEAIMTRTSRLAIDVGGTFTDVVELIPETGALGLRQGRHHSRGAHPGSARRLRAGRARDGRAWRRSSTARRWGSTRSSRGAGARPAIVTTTRLPRRLRARPHRPRADVRPDLPQARGAGAIATSPSRWPSEACFDGTVLAPWTTRPPRTSRQRSAARLRLRRGGVPPLLRQPGARAGDAASCSRAELPGVEVTLSHQLLARVPRVRADQHRGPGRVRQAGRAGVPRAPGGRARRPGASTGRFLMTRSGGGTMTVDAAKERPVNLVLSGPAGGVIGAPAFAGAASASRTSSPSTWAARASTRRSSSTASRC